jgi:hypothetical protein
VTRAPLLTLALAAGCYSAEPSETYEGTARELWDDGRPDAVTEAAEATIVDDGPTAELTFVGCTIALRRVSDDDTRRRFELDGDTQTCAAGIVQQALVGDPVRREPPEPRTELSIEMWLTRPDGAPSLVEFTGQRVD